MFAVDKAVRRGEILDRGLAQSMRLRSLEEGSHPSRSDPRGFTMPSTDPGQEHEADPETMRRPTNWDERLTPPHSRIPWLSWMTIGIVVAYNPISNEILPPPAYVPANLAMSALVTWVAFRSGVSAQLLGLAPGQIRRGVVVGASASLVAAVGVAILAVPPWSREFFVDDRFTDAGVIQAVYQMLIRIPIGTALVEELVFRGAVLGVLLLRFSILRAALLSSALFGLWHVLPTLEALETNPAGDLVGTAIGVAGGVVVTFLAGLIFVWLRMRARSLLAPILAHAALNSTAYLAGWWIVTAT